MMSKVKRWCAENDLLLNADKSEVLMIGTPAQLRVASTVNTVGDRRSPSLTQI